MKKWILMLLFVVAAKGIAQHEINNYRYLILPEKFAFLKQKDQFHLNSLAKLHFEKLGFTVFYDTQTLPDSLVDSNCTKLFADVISTGNFITTKLQISLKDCKNKLVAVSKEGKSKEKDFELSYNQAFREAFTSFRELGYQYQSQQVEKELPSTTKTLANTENLLYAQPIPNGYQLIDSSPKVVYKLLATSNASCFIAFHGEQQGVLVQKNQQWYFECYENGILNSQLVAVKF
ncbi:MAG: hypothetical protein NTX74_07925 [Flavobacterium sp.]|nr:hypothetical protein [Flavobacterium sp.]